MASAFMLGRTLRTRLDGWSEQTDYGQYKTVFSVVTAVVFSWGVIGTLDAMMNLVAGFAATTLTALAFLIFGLIVYRKNPTRLSTSFCSMSLLFAVVLFNPPYFPSTVQPIIGGLLTILSAILFAVVLDYCLNFPRPKKIVTAHSWLRPAIYVIVGAFGVMLATVGTTTPAMTPDRPKLLPIAFILIFGGCMLLSVIAVVHSYIKASTEERSATGLNLMLLGLVIGFGPLLVSILVVHTINSHLGDLPGEQLYDIPLIAIPICLGMALMKLEPSPADVPAGINAKTQIATRADAGAVVAGGVRHLAARLASKAVARSRDLGRSLSVVRTRALPYLRHQDLVVSAVLIVIIGVPVLIVIAARLERRNRAAPADVRSAATISQESESTKAGGVSVRKTNENRTIPVATNVANIAQKRPQGSRTGTELLTPSRNAKHDLAPPIKTEKARPRLAESDQNVRLPEDTASSKKAVEKIVVVVRFENGHVAEAYVKDRRPGMERYEAAALQLARQRRYSKDASGMERIVVTVTSKQ